jgi:hypothetical protein
MVNVIIFKNGRGKMKPMNPVEILLVEDNQAPL